MSKIKENLKEEYFTFSYDENESTDKNLPFIAKALFFCVSGMGFSCFTGLGEISPFAVSFLSAVPFSYCLPTFIGTTLGYFICAEEKSLLKYVTATLFVCLFRLLMHRRFKEKESSRINSVVSFCALFVTGLVFLWFDEMAVLPCLMLVCECILCLFSSLIFIKAFNLPFYKGSADTFSKREVFALVTTLCVTLMCLCSISIQGLSPGRIFTGVLMMFICLSKGAGVSALSGALVGGFLFLTPEGEYLFPAFVTACVISGFLSDYGQTVLSVSYTAVFFLVSLFSCDISESWLSLIEPVIACGIFLLIPADKISEAEDLLDGFLTSHKATDEFPLVQLLNKASENMTGVAEIVSDVSNRLDKIINPEVNRLFSLLQRKVCNKCERKALCWNKDFDSTASDILGIIGVEKVAQKRKGLYVTCPEYDLLCSTLSSAYPSYSTAIATKNKISEMRRILTDQFSDMSDFLRELSDNISDSRTRDKGKSAYLKTALRDGGIPVERLDCYFFKGRVTVEILLCFDQGKYIKKIRPLIEFITGRRFQDPETESSGSSLFLIFREKPAYSIQSGYSQRSMKSGNLCGDTVAMFTCDNGFFNAVISDGMGTGSRAAIDSNLAASVTEKLVCSSFSFESACKTVNNALIMKSTDESIATIDAVRINPYNCKASFYKAGGTLSLIRRGENVTVIEKTSLPLGIIRNVPLSCEEKELKKGDIILLLSDGVTNNDCGWINDELLAWSRNDMQSLASHIASLAVLRSESSTRDDITVVALKIEKAQ